MDSIKYKHGILVGLGSVGTTYFEHMVNRYDFVHVIEIDKSKWKHYLGKNINNVIYYLNIHDLGARSSKNIFKTFTYRGKKVYNRKTSGKFKI